MSEDSDTPISYLTSCMESSKCANKQIMIFMENVKIFEKTTKDQSDFEKNKCNENVLKVG